ncbi:MAG: pilus assembly protein CpaB [Frankiaceae bacterium]|nr:pilus assembly protein CpaB [Frankiaceae bacterium]
MLAAFGEYRALQGGVVTVVAARDLPAGTMLTAADLALVTVPVQAVADGAAAVVSTVVGQRIALPMRRNEPVTAVRLLDAGLLQALGNDLRAVPIRLADPALAQLVQAGALVDVYARGDGGAPLGAVAAGVRVLRVLPVDDQGVVIVVAADGRAASRLTAAAGAGALSVSLRAPP